MGALKQQEAVTLSSDQVGHLVWDPPAGHYQLRIWGRAGAKNQRLRASDGGPFVLRIIVRRRAPKAPDFPATAEASPVASASPTPRHPPTNGPTTGTQPSPMPTVAPTANGSIPEPTPDSTAADALLVGRDGPIFPRGFYYVSYYSAQKAQRLADLRTIAAAGYNLMHTPLDRNDRALLDLAADLNVHIAMEPNDDPAYLLRIFKDHPALALLGTFDDVDAYDHGVPRYSPAHVAQYSAELKALAPNTMTYVSGGYPTRISRFLGTADSIGYQTYPVPFESLSSVTSGYYNPIISDFVAAQQPLIANLQAFGWDGIYRYPTPSEVRNMTYQALAVGVQGILYYTYRDYENNLNTQPALWQELRLLGAELKVIEPYLLSDSHQRLSTGGLELYAARWRRGGKLLLVVINASSSQSRAVSLTFNEGLSGGYRNLFSNRAGLLTLNNRTLSGSLPPQSVQVYELDLGD